MDQSLAVEGVIKELQSSNLSQDLILDTVDSFGYTLASNIAKQGTTVMPKLVELATDIKGKFDVLIRSNVVLAKRLTENKLQEREDRGELIDTLKDLKPEKAKDTLKTKGAGKLGIFGSLGFIAGALVGVVSGFLSEFSFIFSGLTKTIKNSKTYKTIADFFTKFGQFFDDIIARFKNSKLVTKLASVFKGITEFIDKFKNSGLYKGISTLVGKMKGLFRIFSNSPVLKAIDVMVDIAKSTFSTIANVISGIKQGFTVGSKFGSVLGKLLKGVGRLLLGLGKIFGWPLTIIMGIYGAITGFMKGFKEGGIIGGIKGALVGLFDAVIGSLLDLLKDGVSWIAGMLGFEKFSAFLDSFSFTDLFRKFVDFAFEMYEKIGSFLGSIFTAIGDFFSSLPDKIGELFSGAGDALKNLFGNISNTVDKFNKAILKAILPDPNKKREWYNPLSLISQAIPDSVYEYAYGKTPEIQKKEEAKNFRNNPEVKKGFEDREASNKLATSLGYKNQFDAAQAAGFKSAHAWREAGSPPPPSKIDSANMMTVPNQSGAALNAAGNSANTTVVNVTNNSGGNVSNVRSSNVSNNVPTHMPIYTGSMAMGY
jgi:hypothetical protein